MSDNHNHIPPEFDAPGDYYAAMEEWAFNDVVQKAAEMMLMYGKPAFMHALERHYKRIEGQLWTGGATGH